jgi:hypothetical protein
LYKRKNRVKQSRGFAIAYSLALRMYKLGVKGKVFYLTTQPVTDYQRRYLFDLHAAEFLSQDPESSFWRDYQARNEKFREFEENYFELIQFSSNNLVRNLPVNDIRRYFFLFEGKNSPKMRKLKKTVKELKEEKAVFGGIEYHFGGPYFQELKVALDLPEMPLLGSEIYCPQDDGEESDEEENSPLEGQDEVLDHEQVIVPKDLGTKSQCRRLYKEVGVAHAPGSYFPVHDVDTLVSDLYDFMWLRRDLLKFVVKLERSAAGDGNRTYDLTQVAQTPGFWSDKDIGKVALKAELVQQFSEAYERRIHDHGAVFEAFISGDNFKSPAVLGMIKPETVEVYFDYNQILGGNGGQTYMGSLGPASIFSSDMEAPGGSFKEVSLKEPTIKILEGLRQCGAQGAVGVDFVTCDELDEKGNQVRNCYAIENNVRHTGTMYPYRTFFYLVGKEILERKYFASTDSVKVKAFPEGQALNVRRWFYGEYLPNNAYAYNPLTHSGCLIYRDTWALEKMGVACIGDTEEQTVELFEGFKKSISTDVAKYVRYLR